MYYTDDVVDFEDLFMHLTVHCSLKCLGMDTNGNKITSFEGSKLQILFFSFLFLFLFWIATVLSCINFYLNKGMGPKSFQFSSYHDAILVYL